MKRYLIVTSTLILVSAFLAAQQAGSNSNGSGSSKPKADSDRPIRVRVSEGVAKALLFWRVAPSYPEEAKRNHIQGKVELKVLIDAGGLVKEVTLVSGPKELTPPSIDAVKQWKYKPYLLNGKPVAMETTVTLAFEWEEE